MAWDALKTAIAEVIKTNGNQEITGYLLQQEIFRVIDSVGGSYGYLGKATPATDPGTQDGNVFYLASTVGAYPNFGSVELTTGGLHTITKINGVWVSELIYVSPKLFKIGTYLPAPSDPIVLTGGVDNKLALPVSVVMDPLPYGFDIFVTPQGTALRFIGSGLGNGDSAILRMDTMAGLLASTGSTDKVIFKAKTRPYTETEFTNAVDIPGYAISRKIPNNDLGSIALNAPFFRINDGDLIEIAATPVSGITIVIDTFGFEAIQLLD